MKNKILTSFLSILGIGAVGFGTYVFGGQSTTKDMETVVCMAPEICEYICDGIDDDVQIEQAIDDKVSSGGGKIKIMEGIYQISSQMEKDVSDIELVGIKGKTILQSNNNGWILFFGNSGGPTLRENIVLRDIVFDMNGRGSVWGVGISWVKDVLVEGCYFKGTSETSFAALFVGLFSNPSEDWPAKNITIKDSIFDGENISNSWEMVTLGHGKNIKVINSTFKNKLGTANLLNYNSEDLTVTNNTFIASMFSVGGRGKTHIMANTFENSRLLLWNADNVNVQSNSFTGIGDVAASGTSVGILIQGGYFSGGGEVPFFVTAPYTWNCKNINISNNIFDNCNTSAIAGGTVTSGTTTVLSVESIKINNNVFQNSTGNGINVIGSYVEITNNTFKDNNSGDASAASSNILTAGKFVKIQDNISLDKTGTVQDDVRINRIEYDELIPITEIVFNNNYLTNTPIRFYTGSSYSSTIQEGISIISSSSNIFK